MNQSKTTAGISSLCGLINVLMKSTIQITGST